MPITYLFLLFSVVLSLSVKNQKLLIASILVSGAIGFYEGIVNATGLLSIIGFLWVVWGYFKQPSWSLVARIPLFIAMIAYALAFFYHWVPGFKNLLYLRQVYISSGSCPYTMYLNFDKTMMGLILYGLSFLHKEDKGLNYMSLKKTMSTLFFCIALLMPLSLSSGYVKFDYKFSDHVLIWSVTNLFFVCFAEEVLFRGIIQNTLTKLSSPYWVPLLITSILFGLSHFHGGPMYIVLSTVAGLFYGYTYYRTGSILCAMLVHFGLNLCHFIFFSYPASLQMCQ